MSYLRVISSKAVFNGIVGADHVVLEWLVSKSSSDSVKYKLDLMASKRENYIILSDKPTYKHKHNVKLYYLNFMYFPRSFVLHSFSP